MEYANSIMGAHKQSARFTATLMIFMFCLVGCATNIKMNETKKVVLQLTDNSTQKQTLVLNVADNLFKTYQGNVEIEVVAFGPGLQLLFEGNTNQQRIDELAKKGIRFSACRNTVKKLKSKLGKDQVKLHQHARENHGGAERIIELIEKDYILIRP